MADGAFPTPSLAVPPEPALRQQVRDWLAETGATLPPLGTKAKHIRDPLHGSVVLAPHEVRLLDTWPMQRLRGVRQLGLAYLIFPSAGHTRFEHALGVRFVAEQMLARLEDAAGRRYPPEQRAAVLAAALLHDVGHGVFSHTTESISGAHPALAAQYSDAAPLHEQVGALLITADPLAACLRVQGVDPATVAALLRHDEAALIAQGLPPELWGVISGPIDADKLDYFARDSYFAGVASAVDPERLLRTLTVGPGHQLAVTLAGAGAFDQMLHDRVHMYGDLYGHQKILAAECMVRALIEALLAPRASRRRSQLFVRGLDGRSTPISLDRVTDFLRFSDEAFLAAPTDNATVAALQTRLLRRELLHRAYTLSYEAVRGMREDDYLAALARLRSPATLAGLRQDLIRAHPEIPATDLWLAAVRSPTMAGVAESVIGRDGRPVPMGTAFGNWDARDARGVPQHTVARHFELYRARLYVFCPPEHAAAVEPTARALLRAALGDTIEGELI